MGLPPKSQVEQIADLRETIARLQAELTELEVLQHRADEINARLDSAME